MAEQTLELGSRSWIRLQSPTRARTFLSVALRMFQKLASSRKLLGLATWKPTHE
jgi:hypothetical protein